MPHRAAQLAPVMLTLLMLVLGGATLLWQQVIVVSLAGGILLLAPPRRGPGATPVLLSGGLLLLALGALLPAGWPIMPAWRVHLLNDLGLTLPVAQSPQPWITAQACGLLFVGLAWALYLFSFDWQPEARIRTLLVLVVGVALLALAAIIVFAFHWRVPWWTEEEGRGWFPNRNQSAGVLAVTGVAAYGLMVDRFRRGRATGYLLLLALGLITGALVITYSRAGILLFFAGLFLWHLRAASRRGSRRRQRKSLALSASGFFALLTLFLLFGGATAQRFQNELGFHFVGLTDFRGPIQGDAFRFSFHQPWRGVGLGNFEPLYEPARTASINQDRVLHPESDWLWIAVEMGWPAVVVLGAGAGWWVHRCLPFPAEPGETMRWGLFVATLIFFAHSLVDVDGHRLGSAGVALLLAGMALPVRPARPHAHGWLFRPVGLVMLLLAGWWGASLAGWRVPPTSATLDKLSLQATEDLHNGEWQSAQEHASAALAINPIDWRFYFQRGTAEALSGQTRAAAKDFGIARDFSPHWFQPRVDEGWVWVTAGEPDEAADAWAEAVLVDHEDPLHLYTSLLTAGKASQPIRDDLQDVALTRPDLLGAYLSYAQRPEAVRVVARELAQDPGLTGLNAAERAVFFEAWWQNGDRADLLRRLQAHPEWAGEGWPYLAQDAAAQGRFQEAVALVLRHVEPPQIPALVSDETLPQLEHDFYGSPKNVASGVMLYLAEMKAGRPDDALATLRTLDPLPDRPPYVAYLEMQLWAKKEQWELAWESWRAYAGPRLAQP
jgi:tetratricopeptide (TPR) repeat protein